MLPGEGRRGSRTERNSDLRAAPCNIQHRSCIHFEMSISTRWCTPRSSVVPKVIENESLRGGLFQPLNQPRLSHGSRTAQERVHVVRSTHGRLRAQVPVGLFLCTFHVFSRFFVNLFDFFPGCSPCRDRPAQLIPFNAERKAHLVRTDHEDKVHVGVENRR